MNDIFLAVILSLVIAQGSKLAMLRIRHMPISPSALLMTGGMPSAHAALVSSLLSILVLEQGLSSLTAIALVVFIIVIADAVGVRRSVGEEGKALNKIIKQEHLKMSEIKYSIGHKPSEAMAGILIGITVSYCIYFF